MQKGERERERERDGEKYNFFGYFGAGLDFIKLFELSLTMQTDKLACLSLLQPSLKPRVREY